MKKPTIYVAVAGSGQNDANPVGSAIKMVSQAFGGELVDKLVDGTIEADIAIVDSVPSAFQAVKETTGTTVLFAFFTRSGRQEAEAFAPRYPGRVTIAPLVERDGETNMVFQLMNLIAEKAKEV